MSDAFRKACVPTSAPDVVPNLRPCQVGPGQAPGDGGLLRRAPGSRGHSGAGWLAAMALSEAFDAAVYEILAELGTLEASRARRSSVLALTGTVAESVMALAVARSHR